MKDLVLQESKKLYDLGFAILWLHPREKRPVGGGWTRGARASWTELVTSYERGYNVGVRLGAPSIVDGHYLCCIDLDVKDPKFRGEAEAALASLVGPRSCPEVTTGGGNGSRHLYGVTDAPFKMITVAKVKGAWELCIYSEGRQMVLPPSIHPSGRIYEWARSVTEGLPVFDFSKIIPLKSEGKEKLTSEDTGQTEDFEAVDVDLDLIEISNDTKRLIVEGTGVTDRSTSLLPACHALVSAGLTRNEILSVLTNRKYFLGATGYDHTQSGSRRRASAWIWRYTLDGVMKERDAKRAFKRAAVIEPARTLNGDEITAQSESFESERNWRQDLEVNQYKKIKSSFANCKLILANVCEQAGIVGRNEFAANDFYLCDTPWRCNKGDSITDADTYRIKFYCSENFGVEFSDIAIEQTLLDIADRNRFHPVRTWLKSLKWDGKPRINTWLKDYAGAVGPEPYLSDASRKVVCAMVSRIFKPGCKFDHVLILEGNQGVGKSTLLAKLAGEWFSDAPLSVGNKDSILSMQSKWLIEIGELSAMNKAEIEIFKAFISQRVDRIRVPFGKRMEEFPRQSIFIGTTNQGEYFKDLTGNRRYWSVKLEHKKINFNGLAEIREQIFAEAVVYYELGEPLWLENKKSENQALEVQASRIESDEWISIVADIVNSEAFPVNKFEIKDIAKRMEMVGAHKMSNGDIYRISKCLKILKCEPWRESEGARRRLWKSSTVTSTSTVLANNESFL